MCELTIHKCKDLQQCSFKANRLNGRTPKNNIGCDWRTENGFCYAYCNADKLDEADIRHLSEAIYQMEKKLGTNTTIVPCKNDSGEICKNFKTDWKQKNGECRYSIIIDGQMFCAVDYGPSSIILYPDALDRYAYLKNLEV